MNKKVFLILVFLLAVYLPGQKTFFLPDLKKPHQIVVYENELYIFDEPEYSLHVFTIQPFVFKFKIGKKGKGPHDFKYLPFVYVQEKTLACTDFTKTVWFSKQGKIMKVKKYTDFSDFDLNSEMLLIPTRERFLRITADHALEKRYVKLLGSDFKVIKELYQGPFTWKSDAPIHYRTDTFCHGDKIFISDTQKGFFITIFDYRGKHLHTIDKSEEIKGKKGYPLLHQYCVSDDKIYATTYVKKGNKTELIVLDLKGNILKRIYLSLSSIKPKRGVLRYDLFTINEEKLYEMIKKSETAGWELRIVDLNQ